MWYWHCPYWLNILYWKMPTGRIFCTGVIPTELTRTEWIYWIARTEWISCTKIFLLAEYFVLEYLHWSAYFALWWPYRPNVWYWNAPTDWTACTEWSLLVECFANRPTSTIHFTGTILLKQAPGHQIPLAWNVVNKAIIELYKRSGFPSSKAPGYR